METVEKFVRSIDSINYKDLTFYLNEQRKRAVVNNFKRIAIYNSSHTLQDKKIDFLVINDIEVYEGLRSKGIFTQLLNMLESKNIPILIEDIVNYQLFTFLTNRGYKNYKYNISGGWVRSMYLIPEGS